MTPRIYDAYEVEQGSLEWHRLHLGRPTASEFKQFMTLKCELRKGDMLQTYLNRKLAEFIQGHPEPAFSTRQIENGKEWEAEARNWLDMDCGLEVREVGFVENGRCGCSPDGLIGEDEGVEIKCPMATTHVGYLRDGVLPSEYFNQVHGSLYVTGRKRWHFLSYRSGKFKPLLLTVERDENLCTQIGATLEQFYQLFDTELQKLKPASK